jgi:hypothetical protein
MATNKYPAKCSKCGCHVPTNGGVLTGSKREGWSVAHLACENAAPGSEPRVIEVRFNSGAVLTQNRRGRCEDAPCCGCCTC